MIKPKRVLILSFTPSYRSPRVYRQIVFLKNVYQLTVAGFGALEVEGVTFVPIKPPSLANLADKAFRKLLRIFRLKTKQFKAYYWSLPEVQEAKRILSGLPGDLIIAHDLYTLPVALSLAAETGAKVLLDAHEYEPRHFDDSWRFRVVYQAYWDYICRQYLPRVNAMVTVCQGIADEYAKNYGVACEVLNNAPFYEELRPSITNPECIRLMHHGGLHQSRKLESMIFLMDLLDDRFHLDFMFVLNSPRYAHYLKQLKQLAQSRPRIRFCEPVPMPQIARAINSYDIGIFLLSPGAFSYKMALPNKLFEFIQGRLAVAIWPSPEMARIVKEYHCGIVADDFTIEAMAAKLNSLTTQDIQTYKEQSHHAARALCAEANRQMLLDLVAGLIGT